MANEIKVAKASKQLAWKEFSVHLESVDAWMKTNIGDHYCGNSADTALNLWFTDDLTTDQAEAIDAYWAGIAHDSAEATAYQSQAQIAAAKDAKKASGLAKLIALGLTADEAAALLG